MNSISQRNLLSVVTVHFLILCWTVKAYAICGHVPLQWPLNCWFLRSSNFMILGSYDLILVLWDSYFYCRGKVLGIPDPIHPYSLSRLTLNRELVVWTLACNCLLSIYEHIVRGNPMKSSSDGWFLVYLFIRALI